MTPLRSEEISLLCEDKEGGRSQRMLDAAIGQLRVDLPFAAAVRAIGVHNQNDVTIRVKFARAQTGTRLRVFGLRDRDFLPQHLVVTARDKAFAKVAQSVMAWPLPRHSIESYLLDDDLLAPTVTDHAPGVLAMRVDEAAVARRWVDIARGTVADLAWHLRQLPRDSIAGTPNDRATALEAVQAAVAPVRGGTLEELAEDNVGSRLDALAADMVAHGPLRHRVHGRDLVYDVERVLGRSRGVLLAQLVERARVTPPVALVADLRTVLEHIPPAWRVTE